MCRRRIVKRGGNIKNIYGTILLFTDWKTRFSCKCLDKCNITDYLRLIRRISPSVNAVMECIDFEE